MRTLIAADGGNSKTDLAIVDDSGALLSRVRGPGCSPDALGVDGCIDVLAGLIDSARSAADLDGSAPADVGAFFLAGVDQPHQEQAMTEAVGTLGWAIQLTITNDTYAVLRAGAARTWGVGVVCGAGINALGVAADGRVARYQALGELSGDWGGGASVGVAALGAAIRGDDGRGPVTSLTRLVPSQFGLRRPQELADAIHRGELDTGILVSLAPLVLAQSDAGDSVAIAIVGRLADEVAVMATALMRRLDMTDSDAEVVLGGGLMQARHARLSEAVTGAIHHVAPSAQVVVLDVPPLLGAVRAGLDLLGLAPDDQRAAATRTRLDLSAAADVTTAS